MEARHPGRTTRAAILAKQQERETEDLIKEAIREIEEEKDNQCSHATRSHTSMDLA